MKLTEEGQLHSGDKTERSINKEITQIWAVFVASVNQAKKVSFWQIWKEHVGVLTSVLGMCCVSKPIRTKITLGKNVL